MRTRTSVIALIVTFGLLLSVIRTAVYPSLPPAEAAPAIPVERLLNPDGTLRIDGTLNGVIDISGWHVTLDPEQGPIVQPQQSVVSQWTNLGSKPVGAIKGGTVHAIAVIGNDIYLGGEFYNVADIPAADCIVRFNTTTNTWHAVGGDMFDGALSGTIYALAVIGNDLYAGGSFANNFGYPTFRSVARWNGSSWSALGVYSNPLGGPVYALAAIGSDLYIGGVFEDAAYIPEADYLVRFDTTTNVWSAVGGSSALNRPVAALAVNGDELYIGGSFTDAAGIPAADHVVRFNTTTNTWSSLGSNSIGSALDRWVYTLAVNNSDVYIGGNFTNAAGIPEADYVARFNTTTNTWSALGGSGGTGALNGAVRSIVVNSGDVYIGGDFTDAAGIAAADYVARWNGSSWSALGASGGNGVLSGIVRALAINGSDLYIGGDFTNAAGFTEADYAARFDTTANAWSAVGNSINDGALNGIVRAFAIIGSDLYVGGDFTDAGGVPEADYVARWNGSSWSALGGSGDGALNGRVWDLVVIGSDLYVGGEFFDVAGIPQADYAARWNGSSWSALGASGSNSALNYHVYAFAVSGDDIYVGGRFTDAASIPEADNVVRFNTTTNTWSALGGSNGIGALNNAVRAIAVSGSNVYVGGDFINAADIPQADYIARWNGSSWSALGGSSFGNGGALNGVVLALAVSGSDLYVGGNFTDAAYVWQADYIARWNGSSWSALGSNSFGNGALIGMVQAITVSGNDLYVGGNFVGAGSILGANYVARWDGSNWHAVGSIGNNSALTDGVSSLAVIGNDLYVGGLFSNAANIPQADYVAAYAAPPSVQAITRINPNPTSAASVQFQVTFNEPVTDVTAYDFALTVTDTLSGTMMTNISGSGATYTVTIAIDAGAGMLRLDIPDAATISDLAGLRVNNLPFLMGESYTISIPTPTPTAIASPTPTAIASPTPTAIASPTPTAIASPTPTAIASPTPTAIASPTPTTPSGQPKVYVPLVQR